MPRTPDSIVREWFKEVWNEGSEDAIERLMGPDAPVHGLSGPNAGTIRGVEAFKAFFQMFQRAMGDMQIEVVRTVVEGDICAAHCHVVARHTGGGLGSDPTGRQVDFWGMCIVRVRDGQIVEGWNCFDFLAMYQQLGWVKNPPLP
jgi:predicted ester cyclase